MKSTTTRHGGAKLRILETTENLFAETGSDAISIRQITRTAGANVAAVNYHFGSRDGLVSAVLDRHFDEIDRERLFRLGLVSQQVSPNPVEAIFRAFSAPWLEDFFRNEHNRRFFKALSARIIEGGGENGHKTYRAGETPIAPAFVRALQRHFPSEMHEELEERFADVTRDLVRLTFAEIERCEREEGSEPRQEKVQEAFVAGALETFTEGMLPLAVAG